MVRGAQVGEDGRGTQEGEDGKGCSSRGGW